MSITILSQESLLWDVNLKHCMYMYLHTSIYVNTNSYCLNMHMYSIFTVGHNTQYYTDKPQWAEKTGRKRLLH